MMKLELAERIFEANVRIAGMWPFPFGEAPIELLEAFDCSELSDMPEPLANLFASWDDEYKAELFDGNGHAAQEAWGELSAAGFRSQVAGWIVRAECPVFTKFGDAGLSFSWGHYSTENLLAEDAEKALIAACEWAEKRSSDAEGQPA